MRSLFLMVGIMVLVLGVFAVVAIPQAGAAPSTPPQDVVCETAIVDGDPSEWDLTNDFIIEMYEAGDPGKDHISNLYMRHDAATSTVYVLVLMESGHLLDKAQLDNHHIKIAQPSSSSFVKMVDGNSGDDGTPPDFAFIGNTGWEASFILPEGTNYRIEAHAQYDSNQSSKIENGDITFSVNCLGTIGDYVWYDENADTVQDPSENGLDDITVRLFKKTGPSTFVKVDEQITDPVGAYLFEDVPPGNYMVDVHDPDVTAAFKLKGFDGWISTTKNDPFPSPAGSTLTLSQGEDRLDADFGYDILDGVVALGDWVWYDENKNGLQDEAADHGIPCVTVRMKNQAGAVIGVTNTDSWGNYNFAGMLPSPLFSTEVDGTDPDIDNFINAYLGNGGTATCTMVPEVDPTSTASDSFNAPMALPTTPGSVDTTELNEAGKYDPKLDYAFWVSPDAISLASFEVTEAAATPGNWALVGGLLALLGTGALLLKRRKEVN